MWPPAALEFLRDLEDNNDRAWFKAKPRRLRRPPRRARPGARGEPRPPRHGEVLPALQRRALPSPPADQGAARDHDRLRQRRRRLLRRAVARRAARRRRAVSPATDQLERFRSAIDDARRAAAFERAVTTAANAGMTLVEPALKRAPRGYPLDHPRVARLRLKNLALFARHPLEPWLHEERCREQVRVQFDASRPFVTWLAKHVGPSNTG